MSPKIMGAEHGSQIQIEPAKPTVIMTPIPTITPTPTATSFSPEIENLPIEIETEQPKPTISPTSDQTSDDPLLTAGTCLIGNTNGQSINLYAGPSASYTVLTQITQFSNTVVTARNLLGWYRVKYIQDTGIWVGWVSEREATLFGECTDLPTVETGQ